jgi:acid stress-induced BolA-like protein IbaG/YrbA
MQTEDIKRMIEAGLPGSQAHVIGDGTHFEAIVVAEAFRGKRLLQQHRMVYDTLGDAMHSAIHALSLKTYTPDEWAQEGKQSQGETFPG